MASQSLATGLEHPRKPPLSSANSFPRVEFPTARHNNSSNPSPDLADQQSRLNKRVSMATRTDLANRRRSVLRDHKPPQGPRPPDFPSSRRLTSTSTTLAADNVKTSFPHPATEAFLGKSLRQNTPTTDITNKTVDQTAPHAHVRKRSVQSASRLSTPTSFHEAQLDDFPKPGGQKKQSTFRNTARDSFSAPAPIHPAPHVNTNASRSLDNNDDPALRAAQLSTGSSTNPRISRFQLGGLRRQSQLPPSNSSSLSSKQPRKSIGPGYTVPSVTESFFDPNSRTMVADKAGLQTNAERRRASQAVSRNRSTMAITSASESFTSTKSGPVKDVTLKTTPPQAQSAYSFLDLPPPSSPMHLDNGRSPSKPSPISGTLPPLSARRQSTAVSVGGLGARTVSPTDVRRSRRMSTTSRAPPLPTRSPTPELSPGEKLPPTPPFALRHKSMTPSSPRETPEIPQRRNSGRSIESRSSYNSIRPTSRPNSSSSQRRTSFTSLNARSAAIKPRNLHSSGGVDGEMVPPVPAIPKAYESPSETMEKPFFSDINMALGTGNSLTSADAQADERFMTPEEGVTEAQIHLQNARQSRRLTLGARPEAGRDVPGLIAHKPQVQQHQRLPPLNLLPLSTPTANKILSMGQKVTGSDAGRSTPPPSKGGPKTPSTPMTASKATFSSYDFEHSFDLNMIPNLRSSTSYAAQKSETSTLNNESGSESPAVVTPASPAPPTPRHGPSPFGSFSLPRPTAEISGNGPRRNRESAKDTVQHGRRASRSLLRRPSTISKQTKDGANAVTTSSDVEGAQPGTSLRRKLSIGWRRSSSKASHTSQHVDEDRLVQSSDMPPPKLPASSNTNSFSRKNPKPTSSAVSSQTDLAASLSGTRSANVSTTELPRHSTKSGNTVGDRLQTGSKASVSLFSPVSRMLSSRHSQSNMKSHRSLGGLDRDDQVAEDEMRKLATKKREFEASAKELDDLKRRAVAKERVSPNQATHAATLNIFEKGEIIDYQNEGVFFCGTKDAKKFVGDLAQNDKNFGYDDERGDYNIVVGDHLAYRYEVIDVLGKGSFGQVVRCVDHRAGGLVAVKIIRNKKRFHQQALVEVNILQKLREWDPDNTHSMVNFTQCFYFRGHLCIATELLGINLYEFIKAHDFAGFSLKLIRRFTKQMLGSLCLLEEQNVIHCDLKPENILLAHPLHSEIKVIDFGSSCFEKEKVYTYIQSRFYRSPEVILGMNYGIPIDMWSLGCIMAELLTGYPIFPGENESEQLACIMEVFGPPEKHLIEKSTRKKVFFDSVGKPRITVSSKGKRRRPSSKTLQQALKCDDEAFVDFIARCLRWDPDRRLKPHDAMSHEFITGKKAPRARSQGGASATSSSKRVNTLQTPVKSRIATEPPATSYKNGVPAGSQTSSISPVKGGVGNARRKSTMYDQPGNTGTRVSSGSGLPRATAVPRSISSGKPDLASAAAAISLAGSTRNRLASNGVQ